MAKNPLAFPTFGKRLRFLREDRDLTQTELREQLERNFGVSIGQTYISELERSERTPSLEVAAAMAAALGVSLDYLGSLIDEPLSYTRPAMRYPDGMDLILHQVEQPDLVLA